MAEICGCGTCSDANKVAVKLMNEMLDNDCTLWAIQVGLAMSTATGYLVAGMCQQKSMASTLSQDMWKDLQRQMYEGSMDDIPQFTALRDRVIKLADELPADLRAELAAVLKGG